MILGGAHPTITIKIAPIKPIRLDVFRNKGFTLIVFRDIQAKVAACKMAKQAPSLRLVQGNVPDAPVT